MKSYLSKMRGGGKAPARPRLSYVIWSWFGGFLGIAATAYLTHATGNSFETGTSFLIAPFGATCVIAFALPDSPVAQPRNIIGGYFISTLIGLIFLWLGEPVWWIMAVAVATAIAVMQITKTTHPPAGGAPLVVLIEEVSWDFIFVPVLAGSVILVLCALLFNNFAPNREYPRYWS